jgi:hypothetical protein
MPKKLKAFSENPTVRSNVKWAKNTAIGTTKGVAIAAAANIVGEAARQSLTRRLKHKKA